MDDAPLVSVSRGNPTAEELAALVGIVLLRSRTAPVAPVVPRSAWAASGRPALTGRAGMPAPAGPGAWRQSGLPR